jgi:dimethylamine/trimethylamine dehydrogenase
MITTEGDIPQWTLHQLIDDGDIKNLSLLTQKAHEYDALAGVELWYHAGGTSINSRHPAHPGVSTLRKAGPTEAYTVAMTKADIREAQRSYVDAAKRARAAGFDLINIHMREAAGLGYDFLTPSLNNRTDEYGGSIENRIRFSLELFEMVKDAVGDDCGIVGGFCIDTLEGEFGVRLEEDALPFIDALDPFVDLWDLQVGWWISPDAGPSRFYEQGWQVEYYEKVRPHTKKPVVGVGRFTDPDTMASLVRRGVLDVIGAARPSIADPFLPNKIRDGRYEDIRECIGCNFCVSRVEFPGGLIGCTQNATTGEEYRRGWHPELFTTPTNAESPVLVVGAGPAGLECATILGKRGMEAVALVDGGSDIGGIMRWIPTIKGLGQWGRFTDYRRTQLSKLPNVAIGLNQRLTAESILDFGAEIVVIATGSSWSRDGSNSYTRKPVPGAGDGLDHILTPEDIFRDKTPVPEGHIVVFDADGYYMGPSVAEELAERGHRVTLVMPHIDPQGYMHYTGEGTAMVARLRTLGVKLANEHLIQRINEDGTCSIVHVATGVVTELDSSAVVMVTARIPDTGLYDELNAQPERLAEAGIVHLLRIGDCVEPRVIADAAFDGHRLAREIDSSDPAKPLPMIRERRVLSSTEDDFDRLVREHALRPVSSKVTLPLSII